MDYKFTRDNCRKKDMKKVLFIRAVDVISEVESRYPGLGLAYLASSLESHFGENCFDFKIVERGDEKEAKKKIFSFKPDIVGISSVTQNYNLAKDYAKYAKSCGIPVIIGGVHISMLPESLSECMDVACLGEGEKTIVELFELFIKRGGFPKDELKKIKGIAYRESDGTLIKTGIMPLIQKLDKIRMPKRDLLGIGRHSYIFSSRGCPYRCSFCASSRFWNTVRLFSAEYVVKEIKELYEKHNVKVISFYDDLFIISPQRLADITELLKKEGLHGKVKFTCSCRSNLVNGNTAKLLKDMGVVSVGLGLESGSRRILDYLKGESASVEHNINAVKILKENGIAVNASFVIGSPDETESEMMETYDFIKKNKLGLVDIYVLMPLPGTPVWQYALERKLVSEDMDWAKLNVNFEINHKRSIVVSELYTREQMYGFYKKFRKLRLYTNLKNIWRSPFLADLPRYIFKIIYSKFIMFFKTIKNRFKTI